MRTILPVVLLFVACTSDDLLRTPTPNLWVSQPLDFGQVYLGSSAERELWLHNDSVSAVSDITLLEVPQEVVVLDSDLPMALAPHKRIRLRVRFTPTQIGAWHDTLMLTSSAGVVDVALQGEGSSPLACDDGNDCTQEVFDPQNGTCVSANLSGVSCTDGSACTTDDSCAEGVCLGVALQCQASSSCALGVCDPIEGCVEITNPEACDDGNPCTHETCGAQGCESTPFDDYTLCAGQRLTCTGWPLCVQGECVVLATPDGVACDDGSVCSTGDTCQAGACVGTTGTAPPGLLGTAYSYGDSTFGSAMVLSDERVIFLNWRDTVLDDAQIASVRITASGLVLEDVMPVSGTAIDPTPIDENTFITSHPTLSDHLQVMTIAPDGRFGLAGTVDLEVALGPAYAGHVFATGSGRLYTINVQDVQSPVVVGQQPYTGPRIAFGKPTAARPWIFMLGRATTGLTKFDVSNPALPVHAFSALAGKNVGYGGVHGDHVWLTDFSSLGGPCTTWVLNAVTGNVIATPNITCGRLFQTDHGVLHVAEERHALLTLNDAGDVVEHFVVEQNPSRGVHSVGQSVVLRGTSTTSVWRMNPNTWQIATLTGAGHGHVGQLVSSSASSVLSVSANAVLELDLSNVSAPTFVAGGRTLPGLPAWIELADASISNFVVSPTQGLTQGGVSPAGLSRYRVTGTNVAPLASVSPMLPCPGGNIFTPADGRFAYVIAPDCTAEGGAFVLYTLDLAALGTLISQFYIPGDIEPGQLSRVPLVSYDSGQEQLAVAVWPTGSSQAVVVIDVASPLAPTLRLPASAIHVETRRILLGGGQLAVQTDSRVNFHELLADSLAAPRTYGSGFAQILAYDGHIAVVGVGALSGITLRYVDTTTVTPTLVHSMGLNGGALNAYPHDELLLVTSASAVSVVQPPCP